MMSGSTLPYKLSNLPLRPSTLSALARQGFITTADILASKKAGGISNFAAELELPLVEAARIAREVDHAVKALHPNGHGHDPGNKDGRVNSSNNGYRKNQNRNSNLYINRNNLPLHNQNQQRHRRRPQTAASILSAQYNKSGLTTRPIISFAHSIDSLLGGGFQPKEVTEISGLPGVGKTQLAMQLCVDTKLPKEFGGVEGDSVYIDSEGSFSPERCLDMATALMNHLKGSAQRSKGTKRMPEDFTTDSILDSIHVFRVFDESSQAATIHSMSEFLKKMEDLGRPIKLIVVDSIAFHYRCSTHDYLSRTKSLAKTSAALSDIASKFDIAVVVINQMTTKIHGGDTNPNARKDEINSNGNGFGNGALSTSIIPALGESWAHSVTTRLILMLDPRSPGNGTYGRGQGQGRLCKLVKSPHKPAGTAAFTVTSFGVRGAIPGR